jgi:hypothetical protein
MNLLTAVFALGLIAGSLTVGSLTIASRALLQSAGRAGVQQIPASPVGAPNQAVQITNGPVVEHVTDTTAEIAWSTNVNSGTALHYGTDASHLDQSVGMPWGGLTHRVSIKNLKPNTTYYFKAESGQGQGTGTQAETAQASFQTKPAGTTAENK